jgi:DNA polymerase III subunit alpha
MNWFPLKNFTHYSLLKGFSKPAELAKLCADKEYPACGIADYKSISGCVSFFQACKKAGIRPILGCSFDNTTVFAKNKDGWHDLISMVSLTDEDGNMPKNIAKNIITKNNLVALVKSKDNINPSYYTKQSQATLHRILLCSELKTTLPKIQNKIRKKELEADISEYFTKDDKYIIEDKCTKVLEDIYNQCEDYDILNKPMLPKFDCPDGLSEENYLKKLARKGWRELLIETGKVDNELEKQKYLDRFNKELQVIKNANLFGYFLIVQDIIRYVNDSGWMSGPGRGSAAGCLISYLIGITQIDPVQHDLLFERFYNAGRNTGGHVSLPDIDMDVPGKKRDDVIDYLKNTYGKDHVSQMITFGRLQGRSAIKEVLRINDACSFSEMNAITKSVPNEADISDQLAEMDDEDRSIIRWSLLNRADELRDFCHITEGGKLEGDYAEYFQQAIEIEGTFKTQGKHAAGVVISKEPLHTVCPMVKQRGSTEKIAGLEMSDLEALGHVKFDVLGINLLDKLMKIKELTNDRG